MEFLSPSMMWVAAACTLPPLIALYFLKLRRTVYPISSTLLWKKSIEDLHVNAPFQRLRNSILLWLQLLVLLLAALALGQPMLAREKPREKTQILMIDQSASMGVEEQPNITRLDLAKREAKKVIDAMDEHSRAMVIAFCDRAVMVSGFDTDREALKRKIDGIEQTDSTTQLAEAVSLAEAYSQNMIIGGQVPGTDIEVQSTAESAGVVLFSDGRVLDAADLSPQRLDLTKMEVVLVGSRGDNVGIVAMDARRNYEQPDMVQAFATVRNFADVEMEFDATLYINQSPVDVQSVKLQPGISISTDTPTGETSADGSDGDGQKDAAPAPTSFRLDDVAPPGSMGAVAFDEVEFEGSGVVEVRLQIDDALRADNLAWTIVPPPRQVDLLLVTRGHFLLERVLRSLDLNVQVMSPDQYESAASDDLSDGGRSRFDVIVMDRHDTARLPAGNYLFWGGVPQIEGVKKTGTVTDQAIIDWEDNHPVLRHVPVEAINAYLWLRLELPRETVRLIEGESADSTPLAFFTRESSQFLICAIPFTFEDDDGRVVDNTDWPLRWDFVLFSADAIQFLASSTQVGGLPAIRPGEPRTILIGEDAETVTVRRPDGGLDQIPASGSASVTYARTRRVGLYRAEPAAAGSEMFAVNLASAEESRVRSASSFEVGTSKIATVGGTIKVNEPLWPWLVGLLLLVSLIEWIVYNRRVYV